MKSAAPWKLAICVDAGDEIDLDLHKVYRVMTDKRADVEGMIRIVDESGEDYLYPRSRFKQVPATSALLGIFRRRLGT